MSDKQNSKQPDSDKCSSAVGNILIITNSEKGGRQAVRRDMNSLQ